MAICRCEKHGVNSPKYVCSVFPVSHPSSGLICGRKACTERGVVYLKQSEKNDYDNGVDIFKPESATAKFKVQLGKSVPYSVKKISRHS
jgi:hypothetical protein